MRRRANLLASLRRRRTAIGGVVLGVFAMASVTLSAAPCLAMDSSASPAHEAAPVAHESQASAHVHHHARSEEEHGHTVSVAHSGDAAQASTRHSSPHCPHCPPSTSGAGADTQHAGCSELGGAAKASGWGSAQPPVLHGLATARIESPSPPLLRPPTASLARNAALAYPQVALNLRHRVFLI
jgi:hypothetical protein